MPLSGHPSSQTSLLLPHDCQCLPQAAREANFISCNPSVAERLLSYTGRHLSRQSSLPIADMDVSGLLIHVVRTRPVALAVRMSANASLTAVRPASRRHSCARAGYSALKRPPGRQARRAGLSPRHYFPRLQNRFCICSKLRTAKSGPRLSLDDSEPTTGKGRLRPDACFSPSAVPAVPESARRAVRGECAGTASVAPAL